MNNISLFIPNKINVGFQTRRDTYTQKLAYIIYYDNKGVLRKENSWQSWRDKSIPNIEFDNVPIEGFVLNKHAGGYKSGWDYRQSYIRVYDPRDFEFEITVENLLYILEYCDSIKGKGLEGKFVYAWNGPELVLLPENSSDYQQLVNYNKILENPEKITNKTLVPGYTYLDKKNNSLLYLGRFEMLERWDSNENKGYRYCFVNMKSYQDKNDVIGGLVDYPSINGKLIKVESDIIPDDFSNYLDALDYSVQFSPLDKKHIDTEYITLEELYQLVCDNERRYIPNNALFIKINDIEHCISGIYNTLNNYSYHEISPESLVVVELDNTNRHNYNKKIIEKSITLEDFYNKYQIYYKKRYLKNGKSYDTTLKPREYWRA